jgi:hypothetical protein
LVITKKEFFDLSKNTVFFTVFEVGGGNLGVGICKRDGKGFSFSLGRR